MDDVVLLLANSAEAGGNGLLSALGLGWSMCPTPTPPAAIVMFIKVPWDQTNTKHTMELSLVDTDGQPVMLGQDQQGNPAPLSIQAEFETGRPPGIPVGTSIDMAQCINLGPGLPLAPNQTYQWRLRINGAESAARSFFVRPLP